MTCVPPKCAKISLAPHRKAWARKDGTYIGGDNKIYCKVIYLGKSTLQHTGSGDTVPCVPLKCDKLSLASHGSPGSAKTGPTLAAIKRPTAKSSAFVNPRSNTPDMKTWLRACRRSATSCACVLVERLSSQWRKVQGQRRQVLLRRHLSWKIQAATHWTRSYCDLCPATVQEPVASPRRQDQAS